MSQLRLDPLTGRWVVISLERAERPAAFMTRSLPVEDDPDRPCPFCPGNEGSTPPALESYGGTDTWQVRVVPNRYPAFLGTVPMAVTNLGPVFTQAPGSGMHEVLVISPEHDASFADLSEANAALVMEALRARIEEHARIPGLRYSQAIVNCGREAGASMEHPHGQLLGMPFVPREIVDEQSGFARFSGNCILCATVDAEEEARFRMVYADDKVVVACPFWSGTPFEMLVMPRTHEPHLHHARQPDLAAVGHAVQQGLSALRKALGDVPYNLVFHSAPYRAAGDFHWHVHILPKLTTRAGFELGTGVMINLVAPELAAQLLRDSLAPVG